MKYIASPEGNRGTGEQMDKLELSFAYKIILVTAILGGIIIIPVPFGWVSILILGGLSSEPYGFIALIAYIFIIIITCVCWKAYAKEIDKRRR